MTNWDHIRQGSLMSQCPLLPPPSPFLGQFGISILNMEEWWENCILYYIMHNCTQDCMREVAMDTVWLQRPLCVRLPLCLHLHVPYWLEGWIPTCTQPSNRTCKVSFMGRAYKGYTTCRSSSFVWSISTSPWESRLNAIPESAGSSYKIHHLALGNTSMK